MRPVLAALLSALVVGGMPGHARAGEGEHALSLAAGFASVSHEDERVYGGAVGVDYEYGVSPAVSVRASASGGVYDAPAYSGEATVGVTYAVDVIKYVPYIGAGAGGILVGGDDIETSVHPLISVIVGVDLLHSRELSYGVAVRYETLLQETDYLTATARVTWRWGFF